MAKYAQESTEQIYKYPIEAVFKVITESIIKQMKGPGRKNNLNFVNPVGKESDYTLKNGTREVAIHFEVTEFEPSHRFAYLMVVDRVRTEISWDLEDYDKNTTKVVYTERAGNSSFLNKIIKLFNKKKFHRTANGYFYMIDSVLESDAKKGKIANTPETKLEETDTKPIEQKKEATKKQPTKKVATKTTKKQPAKKEATTKVAPKKTTTKKATATKVDYASMTVAALKELAKERDIVIPAKVRRKDDIIALLDKK